MKIMHRHIAGSVLGLVLLGVCTAQPALAQLKPEKYDMKFEGGKGSLKDPLWYTGRLSTDDEYDSRTHRFVKRIPCMKPPYEYIIIVNSYDFQPKLVLKDLGGNVLARGKTSTYQERVDGQVLRVYQCELRYVPRHDGNILEVSSYDAESEIEEALGINRDELGAFSMFVYKLPSNAPAEELFPNP